MTSVEELNKKYYGLHAISAMTKYQAFIDEDNNRLLIGPFLRSAKDHSKVDERLIDKILDRVYKIRYAGVKNIVADMKRVEKSGKMQAYIYTEDFTQGQPIYKGKSHPDRNGTYIAHMQDVGKLTEVCKNKGNGWIYEREHFVELLETLVILWINNVHIEMSDIYVRTDNETFHIVDIYRDINEDYDRENQYFYLAKDPSAKCDFYFKVRHLYDDVAKRIEGNKLFKSEVTYNEVDKQRAKLAIVLLRRWSGKKK